MLSTTNQFCALFEAQYRAHQTSRSFMQFKVSSMKQVVSNIGGQEQKLAH